MNNHRIFFKVGDMFVSSATFHVSGSKATRLELSHLDSEQNVMSFGHYATDLVIAKRRAEIFSKALGGADVVLFKIVVKPVMEVIS